MPIQDIPLWADKDIEQSGYTFDGSAVVDFVVDERGNFVRRPGIESWVDTSSGAGIDGLYWWDRQQVLIIVSNSNTYKVTNSTGTFSDITGDSFEIGSKVYFADFGTALYAANGGQIIKIPASGNTAVVADGDAPTNVSHVATLDKYLIALETGTERYWYSDAGDPDSWSGDFVSAETYPDLLSALGVAQDKLELWGSASLEGHRTSTGSPEFVKEAQYTVEYGISAIHSAIYAEDVSGGTWIWLDHKRRVVAMPSASRGVSNISSTLNIYIDELSTISDAIGSYVLFYTRPHYVLSFPTEGKTICIDLITGKWSELGKWNTGSGSYDQFTAEHFALATQWGLSLVGDRAAGKIHKLINTTYQDLGAILRSTIRTPHIDWGTPGFNKISRRIDFYLQKTNESDEADVSELMIRWRDNGNTTWGSERTVALGRVGKADYHGQLNRLGRYKDRQYEIAISDDAPLRFVRIIETFEVVGPQYYLGAVSNG